MKQEDVYIPVSVNERLPDRNEHGHSNDYGVILDDGTISSAYLIKIDDSVDWWIREGKWKATNGNDYLDVEFWLEKNTELILCSRDDLHRLWVSKR